MISRTYFTLHGEFSTTKIFGTFVNRVTGHAWEIAVVYFSVDQISSFASHLCFHILIVLEFVYTFMPLSRLV